MLGGILASPPIAKVHVEAGEQSVRLSLRTIVLLSRISSVGMNVLYLVLPVIMLSIECCDTPADHHLFEEEYVCR